MNEIKCTPINVTKYDLKIVTRCQTQIDKKCNITYIDVPGRGTGDMSSCMSVSIRWSMICLPVIRHEYFFLQSIRSCFHLIHVYKKFTLRTLLEHNQNSIKKGSKITDRSYFRCETLYKQVEDTKYREECAVDVQYMCEHHVPVPVPVEVPYPVHQEYQP